MRLCLVGVLMMLTGCSAFGLGSEATAPQLAASGPAASSTLLLPAGLLDQIGPEAMGAITLAQANALQAGRGGDSLPLGV